MTLSIFSLVESHTLIISGVVVAYLHMRKSDIGVSHLIRERINPSPSPVEQIHTEYVNGDIGEEELESRLTDALDGRAQVIREEINEVDGIGPTRAAEISDQFESIEAVRRASKEELAKVEHVGEKTANDVYQHFSEPSTEGQA